MPVSTSNPNEGKRYEPVSSNSFWVEIGSDIVLSFARISNISTATEFDVIPEGGVNDRVLTFTKQGQQPETLVLERGVSNQSLKELKKAGLKPGGRITQPVSIYVMDTTEGLSGKMLRGYGFDTGIVVKWELAGLDAMSSEVLIERFEIAHTGLKQLML